MPTMSASTWIVLESDCGRQASVENASIQFACALGSFHYQGRLTLERFCDSGLFRLAVDGVEVLWYPDGTKMTGRKQKFPV